MMLLRWLLFTLLACLVLFGVRRQPSSWNDTSRMAAVESLVDYRTLAIDRSIFTPETFDKIYVAGHFYSDKSPVPALWLAFVYLVLQTLFGLHAASNPALFYYLMGLASSGLAYLLAAAAVMHIASRLRLPAWQSLLLTSSFALATLAPAYMRNVNGHIMLLAAAGWLLALLIPASSSPAPFTWQRALILGAVAGLAYTIDLGVGPVILMGTGLYMCWMCLAGVRRPLASEGGTTDLTDFSPGRKRLKSSFKTVVAFTLAALPFFLLHHVLNYAVGQTLKPANAVPEYFEWEGSKFSRDSLTGTWIHPQFHCCVQYGLLLLVGPHGFLSHQPTLFLALVAHVLLFWRRIAETPLLALAAFWSVGGWLMYTVASNNYAGECCSIRWFVPLLAPAYLALALMLKYLRDRWVDLGVLSVWGLVIALAAFLDGPWLPVRPALLWVVQIGALSSWIAVRGILHFAGPRWTREMATEPRRADPATPGRHNNRLPTHCG